MASDPQTDLANAGGALTMALFDILHRRGIITRGDGLAALTEAAKRCDSLGDIGAAKVLRDAFTKMSSGS